MKKLQDFLNSVISDNNIYAFLLFLSLFIIVFAKNEVFILPHHDDVTHASIAKRMVETNNYFEMYEGKDLSFLKPPLYFWLEAVCFKVFGINDYSARFPSAMLGFLTILLAYLITKKLFDENTSLFFLFITLTSFYFLKFAKQAMLDMPVAFSTTLAIYSFTNIEFYNRKIFYILFAIAVASGYYFKAIQGLYPIFIVIFYFILTDNFKKIFSKEFLLSLLFIFLLILLWIFPQYLKFGDTFFYSQCGIGPVINRGIEGQTGKFYQPFLKLIGLNLPWGIINLYGIYVLFRDMKFSQNQKNKFILILSWFFVILLILSLSKTFYLRYLIPLYVPYSILGAIGLKKICEGSIFLLKKIFFLLILSIWSIFLILPISPYYYKGTNYFDMYQVIKNLNIDTTKIIIFKEKYYKLNQGLSYYSSIIPSGYVKDGNELLEKSNPDYTYVSSYKNLTDLLNNKEFNKKINIIAFSKNNDWAIFNIK